jgi:uncharacterized protein YacL
MHRARPPIDATAPIVPRPRPVRRYTWSMGESRHNPELHPAEAAQRQRGIIIQALRVTFFVLTYTVTILAILQTSDAKGPGETESSLARNWYVPVAAATALWAFFILADVLTARRKIATIGGILFGLMVGFVVSFGVGLIIDLLAKTWDFDSSARIVGTTKVLFGIALCYLSISTILQTQDDFRLVIPYVEFAKQLRGPRPLLLDTSALIDARIVDVAGTGIVQYPVVIPHFVITELQALADSDNKLKRARGRRGLDVIARLQRTPTLDLSIDETIVAGKAVDQQLVELARRMPATILTTDIALGRIASIQNVRVLNLNDVANALKPNVIPGEPLSIKLIKRGEQPGQAVGYLEDGTMVVAEDGGGMIGQRVTLSITSTLQTSAGRMIFGRLMEEGRHADDGAPDPNPHSAPTGAPTTASTGAPGIAPATAAAPVAEPVAVHDEPPTADSLDGLPAGPAPAGAPAPSAGGPGRPGPFPPRSPGRPNPSRNPRR